LAIPLLIEANMTDCVDRILVLDLSTQNQLQRLCKRDDLSLPLAENMVRQQTTKQQRLSLAADVILNDSDIQHLADRVSQLHEKYLSLAISPTGGCQSVDSHGE